MARAGNFVEQRCKKWSQWPGLTGQRPVYEVETPNVYSHFNNILHFSTILFLTS